MGSRCPVIRLEPSPFLRLSRLPDPCKAVRKARLDEATMILIAPWCPTQTWFPDLRSLATNHQWSFPHTGTYSGSPDRESDIKTHNCPDFTHSPYAAQTVNTQVLWCNRRAYFPNGRTHRDHSLSTPYQKRLPGGQISGVFRQT